MPYVFIYNGNTNYQKMFIDQGWRVTHIVSKANLVQFCGGADISPSLYGQKTHKEVMYVNKARDELEIRMFKTCFKHGIPMAGICRGAQFLHVMSGGSLFQHVTNHGMPHYMYAWNRRIKVTSTHHQMMADTEVGEVVSTAGYISGSKFSVINGKTLNSKTEDIEVMFHPNTNSLSFQPHPEHPNYPECTKFYFELLDHYFGLSANNEQLQFAEFT